MKTTIIALMSIFLVAFTCEGDKKTDDLNNLEEDVSNILNEAGIKAEDFKGKLDELLTLEMAAQVTGLPAGEAEKETTFINVSYQWDSDRTTTVEITKGNKITVPASNSIELSWVKNTTLEEFKRQNRNPTAEELAKREVAIDNKLKELEADGKATNDQSSAASGIAKSAMASAMFEDVPNLGTHAVFVNLVFMGMPMRDLTVFYRGIQFTLSTDLSADAAYNDKKAIETAKLIIKKLN
jgi:murein L,D-transpeptidase YcbB/YkuD